MFDETLLDDAEALTRADPRGLLRDAAGAGARVRTAARLAAEAGITGLRPDGRPRTVLTAGPGTAATAAADLLGTLAGGACPVVPLAPTGVAAAAGALRWALPGWAGPVDLLLIATHDGGEPGLALLAEQAYRRGCTVVAVAPDRTPVAEAVQGAHGLAVPMATAPGEVLEEEPVEAYANGTTAPPAPSGPCSPRCCSSSTAPAWSTRTPTPSTSSPTVSTPPRNAAAPPSPPTPTPPRHSPQNWPSPCPSSGPRDRAPDRSVAVSPPSSPNSPVAPPSRRPSRRHLPPTARSSSRAAPTPPTPTTSSGTASRSPARRAPAWSCSATGRRAA